MNGIQITTAIDAIEESVRHTCCVTMDDAPGLREALLVIADELTEYAVLPLVRLAAGVQEAADE